MGFLKNAFTGFALGAATACKLEEGDADPDLLPGPPAEITSAVTASALALVRQGDIFTIR